MKVYLAAVHHKHGTTIYAAQTPEQRNAKVAEFCKDSWNEYKGLPDHATLTDQEIIDAYFEADAAAGGSEYVDLDEDEF